MPEFDEWEPSRYLQEPAESRAGNRNRVIDSALFRETTIRPAVASDYAEIDRLSRYDFLQAHFGKAIKQANFAQVCERIEARQAKEEVPATEQFVAIDEGKIVGFVRFQHQDKKGAAKNSQTEEGVTFISHLFAERSNARTLTASGDPEGRKVDIAGMLEQEVSRRAKDNGSAAITVQNHRYAASWEGGPFSEYRRVKIASVASLYSKAL